MPITYSVCEKVCFTIENGQSKILFFNFGLFSLSKFQMTIAKNLIKVFEGFKFYCVKNIFGLHIFCNKTVALLIFFFEIFRGLHFVSLFFLDERNITTSLLMIHLKCTVAHYANLNSSSENKPFLNYGSLNMLFRFFRFFISVYFNETFVKKFMK